MTGQRLRLPVEPQAPLIPAGEKKSARLIRDPSAPADERPTRQTMHYLSHPRWRSFLVVPCPGTQLGKLQRPTDAVGGRHHNFPRSHFSSVSSCSDERKRPSGSLGSFGANSVGSGNWKYCRPTEFLPGGCRAGTSHRMRNLLKPAATPPLIIPGAPRPSCRPDAAQTRGRGGAMRTVHDGVRFETAAAHPHVSGRVRITTSLASVGCRRALRP